MNFIFYLFPSLFLLFTLFFAWIAISVLILKKPVIISAKWINGLVTLSFLPIIVISLLGSRQIEELMIPALFVVMLIFYYFIIKGYLFYGITADDFRKYLLESLKILKVEHEESMSKIKFKNDKTELNITLQERMGAAMIKMKHGQKSQMKPIITTMKSLVHKNQMEPKKITGIFYLIFTILFGTITIVFSNMFLF